MSCEWCGYKGATVQHHYPVQRQYGGNATIGICRNCHQAAHQGIIIDAIAATDEDDFQQLIEKKSLAAIQRAFPFLYAQGQFYEPFTRKMVLTPPWKWKKGKGRDAWQRSVRTE